jgi:hypothetical protein
MLIVRSYILQLYKRDPLRILVIENIKMVTTDTSFPTTYINGYHGYQFFNHLQLFMQLGLEAADP